MEETMKKKIATLVICLMLISVIALPVSAFNDISDPVTEIAANTLSAMGIIDGFPGGMFMPEDGLTRAQFAKIAVGILGSMGKVALYKNYTIFPDVPHTHWASAYVNICVSSESIISGFPDGTFRPDDPLTDAQAITMALKILGYAFEDIGPMWPSDYIEKAEEIGLTKGIIISSDQNMKRWEAAVLMANLLVTPVKGDNGAKGPLYVTTLNGETSGNTVLLATPETDSSLNISEVKVALAGGTASSIIQSKVVLPKSLVGSMGILMTSQGAVTGFVPYSYTRKDYIVSSSKFGSVITADGSTLSVPSTTPIVLRGEKKTFSDSWFDITSGMDIVFNYDSSGNLVLLSCAAPILGYGPYILLEDGSATYNPLKMFFTDLNADIYKNGVKVSYSDLKKYDVVSYNMATSSFNVCDNKITGIYSDAYPSVQNPSSITVMGLKFSVLPKASPQFLSYKIGSSVTLLLTSDGSVAGVVNRNDAQTTTLAVLSAVNGKNVTLSLINGVTIEGSVTMDVSSLLGQLVEVTESGNKVFSIVKAGVSDPTGRFDKQNLKIGTKKVLPNAMLFEKSAPLAPLRRIDLKDLPDGGVPSGYIKSVLSDSSGNIKLIVFGDVTGDGY